MSAATGTPGGIGAAPQEAAKRQRRNLIWYLIGICCWFGAFGVHIVLFPWLVAFALRESAENVGIAQTVAMLPTLLLVLYGGAVADRFGARAVAIGSYLYAALPALVLLAAHLAGQLSYGLMIAYAVLTGIAIAFVSPAREGLVPLVAGGRLQRTIVIVTGVMFGIQIVGFAIAGAVRWTGPAPLLLLQALVLVFGALAMSRLRLGAAAGPARPDVGGLNYLDILRQPLLKPILVLNLGIGAIFFGAVFMVGVPLLLRDVYDGSAADLSMASACNTLGIVVTTVVMLRFGEIRRQGRALLLGLAIGCLCLLGLSLEVHRIWAYAMIFAWGLCGGISISMGRTIAQELAPEGGRGRVMAFYTLAFMGGSPIGAFAMGLMIAEWGAPAATRIAALAMLAILLAVAALTPIWRIGARGALGDAPNLRH